VLWCLPLERDRGSLEGRRGRPFVGPLRFFWAMGLFFALDRDHAGRDFATCGFDCSFLFLERGDSPRY
jgi:hypothetical protein